MEPGSRRPWRAGEILIREATKDDALDLAGRLAGPDRREIKTITGKDAKDGLLWCHAVSDECWCGVTEEGDVLAMWGVVVNPGPATNVWLLCAPEVRRAPVAFSRIVQEQLRTFANRYGPLFARADARNEDHLRWIERIGFKVNQIIPEYGVEGLPFYEYVGGVDY